MRGRFITLEGTDRVGKSTQASYLKAWLQQKLSRAVLKTREPGGTPLGDELRRLILHGDGVDATTEVLLMFAARREHLRRRIEPALNKGEWVICDRFTDSTIAYQGGGRGVAMEYIDYLINMTHSNINPDLTFYFPSLIATRPPMGKDTFERESRDFFCRVEDVYRRIADREPERVIVIESMSKGKRRTREEIAKEIRQIVTERLLGGCGK